MLTVITAAFVLQNPPTTLTEKITSAAMFKNGFAVILREMDVPGSGDYLLERIPEASLGTLWFSTSDGAKLMSVVNTEVTGKAVVPAQSLDQLISMNVGKRVQLTLRTNEVVSGELIRIDGSIIELREGGRTTAIEKSDVRKLASTDPLTDTSVVPSVTRGLRFHIDAHGAAKLFMLSLERGLTWAPAYAVTLKDGKRLDVVGKATVTDDLEALNGIETRFVTGWPNMPYANERDPLVDTFQIAFANGPQGMAGAGGGGGFGGGRFAGQAPAAKDMAEAMPMSNLEGVQAEDLFFYRQPGVTLKRGDRGYFVVLSMEAPYEDLYTWDIPDFVNDGRYDQGPIVMSPEAVWHRIRFKNTSHVPFSTGPATILKDGQMLGQDSTTYTPAGAESELRITQALDLSPDQLEEELSRDRAALKNTYNQPTYDLVTLKGTLTVTSHKTEATPVRIRKNLTGDVVSTSPDAKVTRVARGLHDVNSHAIIEWKETVQPGKTLTLTYQYKVYIRV